MLDIKFIQDNTDLVKQAIKNKNMKADVDALLASYDSLKKLRQDVEMLRSESNQVASAMKSASNDERPALIEKGKDLKQKVADAADGLKASEEKYEALLLQIPNVHDPKIPLGKDDKENVEIFTYGTPTKFSFKPKDHMELATSLDLVDFEAGAAVAGSKFYFLKNEAVLLELALTRYAFDLAIKEGYIPLITPDLARTDVLMGTGYNPRGDESQIYNIEGTDLNLIATSEITVGGMFRDKIFSEDELPLKYVALSHCFRREAGSAGQESKGLYRVHQFSKVELFQFTHPSQSGKAHDDIRALEEKIFSTLEIPFRTVDICSGDLGAPAYKKYDLEAWMPGKGGQGGEYGEITSTSNCTDFQARRLKIRYKDSKTGNNEFVHTLNGTAMALSRGPIALLENFQQEDGSILIPKALQPYTGFDRILPKNKKQKAA